MASATRRAPPALPSPSRAAATPRRARQLRPTAAFRAQLYEYYTPARASLSPLLAPPSPPLAQLQLARAALTPPSSAPAPPPSQLGSVLEQWTCLSTLLHVVDPQVPITAMRPHSPQGLAL